MRFLGKYLLLDINAKIIRMKNLLSKSFLKILMMSMESKIKMPY